MDQPETIIDNETLELLAECLRYPTEPTTEQARQTQARLTTWDPEVASAVGRLADAVEADLHRVEERYTMLFDLNPVCNMYVSHHIFGDDYRRGAALAGLRAEFMKVGLSERGELPDYLPNLLCLLAQMQDPDDRQLLLEQLLLPGTQRIAKRVSDNEGPYPEILRGLPRLLGGQDLPPEDEESHQEVQSHV